MMSPQPEGGKKNEGTPKKKEVDFFLSTRPTNTQFVRVLIPVNLGILPGLITPDLLGMVGIS